MEREQHSHLVGGRRHHFWTDRLWALARELPVREVAVDDIPELDQDCWFHGRAPTCRQVAGHARRIHDADLRFPVILASDGSLMDGGHRICQAWLRGQSTVRAVRFLLDPAPDWVTDDHEGSVTGGRRARLAPMTATAPESRRPGWMLDEVASAGRENLDAEHVARYDAKEDAAAAEEVARLAQLGVLEDATVVDLGAGTGQFTLAVAARCARVVAVDVSPVMLAALGEQLRTTRGTRIEVVQAGFLTYEHQGDPADLVYSRHALHHLPDAWKAIALTRMRRMLRTGGVLRLWDVVYDFGPEEAEERLEAWCATGGAGVVAEWSRAELEEHVRDEHSTFTWLLEPMIHRAGFAVEEALHSDDGIFARYLLRAV